MKRKKSPCIDICEFTGPNNWCVGCGLTRQDCKEWKYLKPYNRNALEKELEIRMKKMKSKKNP